MTAGSLRLGEHSLSLGQRTRLMGVVNVTPDSFSDGGRFFDTERAIAHGLELAGQGASILDVGGESTRPGAPPVKMDDELSRVLPVIEALVSQSDVPVSIDTFKPGVARAAAEAGATLINDITGLRDPAMVETVAELGLPVVVMHMLGDPLTMQGTADPTTAYDDVVDDVIDWLGERVAQAGEAGIARDRMVLDPGLGFGKTVDQNLRILSRLEEFRRLGCPLLVGPSRKSFIGAVLGLPVTERLEGTLGVVAACAMARVEIVRVHDVAEAHRVTRMIDAIVNVDDGR